tara:strand:- start:65851 stop:67341 length:1491 start_codon:yes stop_codon:yes gene_type:complete
MDDFQPVIGLEVHVQLSTKSKMFCSCSRDYFNASPNTKVCPVCLGMPGVLPVINKKAVELTILTGLAFGCKINEYSTFARKNYPYPDLVKGYQISQFEAPLCLNGSVKFNVNNKLVDVALERIHLEEDTARLIHDADIVKDESVSLMDVNRSGVPLMEVVSKPDIHSADEAIGYLKKLRQTLRYLEISDADMEKGSFRCDANISVKPKGAKELGNKVEVKNMNSFRSIHKAIETEIVRQSNLLIEGEQVVQETRGFIDAQGITVSQRSKEQAHDYRYFPEPDLPPLIFNKSQINKISKFLIELPNEKSKRFQEEYALAIDEAEFLSSSKLRANNFEETVKTVSENYSTNQIDGTLTKIIANWYMGDIAKNLNQISVDAELQDTQVDVTQISSLITLLLDKAITNSAAKTVLEKMFENGQDPKEIVENEGLAQMNNDDEIDQIIEETIANNEKAIADFNSGKETALGFLVGQVMKATRGRLDANNVKDIILKKLNKD